jgi:hypothetical protein
MGEAVDLLERIAADGLLDAIASGTFGSMRRPPEGGKGADGVIARAPTTTTLPPTCSKLLNPRQPQRCGGLLDAATSMAPIRCGAGGSLGRAAVPPTVPDPDGPTHEQN